MNSQRPAPPHTGRPPHYGLPYATAAATRKNPGQILLEFLQSTYKTAADCASWDRAALERHG